MTEWRCPRCSADSIQKLSVLHAAGTSSSTAATVLGGIGGAGGWGVGGAIGGTFGSNSTELAEMATPPSPPGKPCFLDVLSRTFVSLTALSLMGCFAFAEPDGELYWNLSYVPFVGTLVLGMPIYLGQRRQYLKSIPSYREAVQRWQRTYFCHRCGNLFGLDE